MISIRDDVRNTGYAHLSAYEPGKSTEELLHSLGIPLSLGTGSPVRQLTPKSKDGSTPNAYSGIFGYNQFPLHTDLAHWRIPPRFLVLRCIRGFAAVSTLLVDGAQIVSCNDRGVFSRTLVRPRRPIRGSLPLLRLYDRQQGDRGLLRWDEVFIRAATQMSELGMRKFKEALARTGPMEVSLVREGDMVVLDNWRMLHGRSVVPVESRGRVLERAYLEKLH
jgi:L-asparagine oxygenase